jgi:hypothetical protein
MELALDPNTDADKLAKLLDAQLRWEANEARKQFETAFELFKRKVPELLKTKRVEFANKGGDVTRYAHAELEVITPILIEALLAYGITHRWKTDDKDGRPIVTLVLKGFGHTEEAATLSGPPDMSGGKNSIQAIGSTVSYLERYTLIAGCGLAVKGQDDDGRSGECMPEQAIEEYCIAMGDETEMPGLQKVFKEAYQKAKALKDSSAQARLTKVYETRKREILGGRK